MRARYACRGWLVRRLKTQYTARQLLTPTSEAALRLPCWSVAGLMPPGGLGGRPWKCRGRLMVRRAASRPASTAPPRKSDGANDDRRRRPSSLWPAPRSCLVGRWCIQAILAQPRKLLSHPSLLLPTVLLLSLLVSLLNREADAAVRDEQVERVSAGARRSTAHSAAAGPVGCLLLGYYYSTFNTGCFGVG